MYPYSLASLKHLSTCDSRLYDVFTKAAELVNITIIEGHRGEARQNQLRRTGKSQVSYPNSDHNSIPSRAVDAMPYPIDWKDRERATLFAGLIMGIGHSMGIRIGWGGDWDSDWKVQDNNFDDFAHFFLIKD